MKKMRDLTAKSERTLLTALILSAPGPLFTGISVIMSNSATQTADFLRRSAELVAIFASWWIYRKIKDGSGTSPDERLRLERIAGILVSITLIFTGLIMIIVSSSKFIDYESGGNVMMGLSIASLGLIANTWFWFRYRGYNKIKADPVIIAQQKLYRAKAFVDLCVVTALASVAIAPGNPVTMYIDICGSVIISIYLIWNGAGSLKALKTKEAADSI